MRRISVVGNSGSGKTTLSRAIARQLRIQHFELDAIHHQQNWQPLPVDLFRRQVDVLTARPAWVVDGNYGEIRDLVWTRADTVIWMDLPLPAVLLRVARRSVWRARTATEL